MFKSKNMVKWGSSSPGNHLEITDLVLTSRTMMPCDWAPATFKKHLLISKHNICCLFSCSTAQLPTCPVHAHWCFFLFFVTNKEGKEDQTQLDIRGRLRWVGLCLGKWIGQNPLDRQGRVIIQIQISVGLFSQEFISDQNTKREKNLYVW